MHGINLLPLCERALEPGEVVTLVGNGVSGTGLTGGDRDDREWRRATNRVVDLHGKYWFSIRFDPPGSGTDHEGIAGVGDSGSPALIEVGNSWQVVGVASWEDSRLASGRGRYGTLKFYVVTGTIALWIHSTNSH